MAAVAKFAVYNVYSCCNKIHTLYYIMLTKSIHPVRNLRLQKIDLVENNTLPHLRPLDVEDDEVPGLLDEARGRLVTHVNDAVSIGDLTHRLRALSGRVGCLFITSH